VSSSAPPAVVLDRQGPSPGVRLDRPRRRAGRPDRRVTWSLRPSRVRPPGPARHRPGHL